MKKFKLFLIALAVILVAAGGYILYELKFKTYDVADEKVEDIVESEFEVELPDGTVVKISKDGNIETLPATQVNSTNTYAGTTNNSEASSQSNEETQSENGSGSTGGENSAVNAGISNSSNAGQAGAAQGKDRVTVATIKDKYNNTFSLIEEQTRSRLNALIAQAKEEYKTKKNNGEKISYGYFYRKYMGAANSLENSTNTAVKAVVKLVEADLKSNGYDASHAQSFVEQYESTKENLRNDLMKKVLNY